MEISKSLIECVNDVTVDQYRRPCGITSGNCWFECFLKSTVCRLMKIYLLGQGAIQLGFCCRRITQTPSLIHSNSVSTVHLATWHARIELELLDVIYDQISIQCKES